MKKVKIKPRNWLVPLMRATTKPKIFLDKKKNSDKLLCRKPIDKGGDF